MSMIQVVWRFQTLTYICSDRESNENSSDNADIKDTVVTDIKDTEVTDRKDAVVMTRNRIIQYIISNGLKGIDRVVPIGHSVDFDLVWDGYDLINYYTRVIG